MFERFTARARAAVRLSQQEARASGDPEVGPEHLLLAMLADGDCLATRVLHGLAIDRSAVRRELGSRVDRDADVLRAIGIDLDAVRRRAEEVFGPGALNEPIADAGDPGRSGSTRRRRRGGGLPFAGAAKAALAQSLQAAVEMGDNYIGTEHLLLGLVADADSTATRALRRLGLTPNRAELRARIREELGRAA